MYCTLQTKWAGLEKTLMLLPYCDQSIQFRIEKYYFRNRRKHSRTQTQFFRRKWKFKDNSKI